MMDLSMLTMYFTQYGAIAIFVIVLLEYMNLPGFPAGVIMPLSGIMAAKGNISFTMVMIITVLAGVLGSILLYLLGLKGGALAIKAYTKHFPKQKPALDKAMGWVQEKGTTGVFVAKMIPMLRTLISIPAGALQMHFSAYLISSTLGICIWNLVFVGAGYLMGDQVFELLGRL